MAIGRLHVLTDFHFQQRFSHAAIARYALQGGADVVQFRQKGGTMRSKLVELQATAEACANSPAALVVDDHIELALAVGADGVHLGQDDLPVNVARRIMGDGAVIGATASDLRQARQAEDGGASYIGFGPMFRTGSKANPLPLRSFGALERLCAALSIPVVAIGGITPERVAQVLDAGAHGVAVMTAVSTAPDPAQAARAFRDAIDRALTGGG